MLWLTSIYFNCLSFIKFSILPCKLLWDSLNSSSIIKSGKLLRFLKSHLVISRYFRLEYVCNVSLISTLIFWKQIKLKVSDYTSSGSPGVWLSNMLLIASWYIIVPIKIVINNYNRGTI